MKKFKVLFLTRRFSPHIGGVETHLAAIIPVLQTAGATIQVITEQHAANLPAHENTDVTEIWRIPLPNQQTAKVPIWQWVISHFQLFFTADIIHIHDVFFWILPIFPLLWLFNKKIFITFHGYEAPGPLTRVQIFWHRVAAHLSTGNICVGGFHQKYYGVEPDEVTYGGVQTVSAEKKSPENILFVGRLAEDTGIRAYVEAIGILKPQVHLDIFGDGELREELEKYSKAHSLDIQFHGFKENATKLAAKYHTIFASQYLMILSGLANSARVIAFGDTPIKNEYVANTPFIHWIEIAHSAQEIAAAVMKKKTAHPAAVQWAQAQTWQKVADQYVRLWKKS